MTESSPLTPDQIMAVDDQPENLRLLEDMLQRRGYRVRSFPRGRHALAAAIQSPPDLILLDINMPEMNGYEVSERLKADERLSRIPVIFLSALNEVDDKVKAFRSGGVDYVSKPFQFDEVHARVETHLQLHRLQRALQLQNERLEETVAARTRELVDAHARLTILDRAKTEFLNLISHELRTPLTGLIGVGELLLHELESAGHRTDFRAAFVESRQRILSFVDDALLVTQMHVEPEKFTPGPVSLMTVWNRAVEEVSELAGSRHVMLKRAPTELGFVLGEDDLLVKALRALQETAVKFSTAGEAVRLRCEAEEGMVRLIIDSSGVMVPASLVDNFFDLLSIGESDTKGGDVGLGPPMAYRILTLFGGSVRVENRGVSGIRLTACLKSAHSEAHAMTGRNLVTSSFDR